MLRIRIVPPQTPTDVDCKVREYVNQKFKDLCSKNTMDINMIGEAGEAWEDDHNHWNYKAADRATQVHVFYYTSTLGWCLASMFSFLADL